MKILIAPLDWGLGHTTRCIPLIHYLLQEGHQVFTAAEGASALLLAENFPELPSLPLAGYRIRYGKTRRQFSWQIVLQLPKIWGAIRREHLWLEQQQRRHQFDMVVADNRYGLYHDRVPCVILTHQLQIKSGKGPWIDKVLQKLHYRLLDRFRQCWIVDRAGREGLSGDLGHPSALPAHAHYVGLLSQFAPCATANTVAMQTADAALQQPLSILILLSGPEPMRGQLESLLLQQIIGLTQYQFVVVAGNPLMQQIPALPPHVRYYSHLEAKRLRMEISKAALVICRSGYSTIMDLAIMEKKGMMIPTPGQTEQEYLADSLYTKGYGYCVAQDKVRLTQDIPQALSAKAFGTKEQLDHGMMAEVINAFIDSHVQRKPSN